VTCERTDESCSGCDGPPVSRPYYVELQSERATKVRRKLYSSSVTNIQRCINDVRIRRSRPTIKKRGARTVNGRLLYHDTGHRENAHYRKLRFRDFCPSQRYPHTRVIPNAAAKTVNKPSATRWLADEDDWTRTNLISTNAEPELDEAGTGLPVGNVPTPLVIGPLSVV
jgi:hypothetical protein